MDTRKTASASAFYLAAAGSLFAATGDGGWIGRWRPGIGDPTVGGWLAVAGYAAAVVLCILVVRASRENGDYPKLAGRERALWTIFAIALAFLGLNKQLDLQSAMTEALRILAKSEGWYRDRGVYQALFILALGFAALVAVIILLMLIRRLSPWTKLASAGLVLIIAFVLARAASFHHVDVLLTSRVIGMKVNWLLELGGISLVIVGASARMRSLRAKTEAAAT